MKKEVVVLHRKIIKTKLSCIGTYTRYVMYDVIIIFIWAAIFSYCFDFSWADPSNMFRQSTEDDRFSTKTFFQIKNHEEHGDSSDIFVLADIEDLTSREKIAKFIDTIYQMNPAKVAVDLIFPSPQDSTADKALIETAKKIKDKAVFACMLRDFIPESQSFQSATHSFFLNPQNKEYYCSDLNEGYANFINNGTNTSVWKYSLTETLNGEIMLSLPAATLSEDIEDEPHTEHIINYDKMNFTKVSPYHISREQIEGNYVIVGAYNYSGDKFDTPFGLIPGMLIHTYIMQSENSDEITSQSDSEVLTMTLVCLFLFVLLMVCIDCLIEFLPFKSISFFLQSGFMSLGLSFIAVYFLMQYCYDLFVNDLIFANGRAALNGILIMTSIVKAVHASLIFYLKRHGYCPYITRFSVYQLFKK